MRTQKRAYILVFVLGVTTVVTALGLSYVSSNGTVMQQAANRYASVRAQYVAESGAALGNHFIHYPPATVAYNGVYSGATALAIDNTFDTVDITVTPSTPANRYIVQATSTVRNEMGTESLGKQSIQSESIVPPEPKWKLTRAALFKSSGALYSGVIVSGNIHCNGNLSGWGHTTGAVSASGAASWAGTGPPSSVRSSQPAVTAPPFSTSLYSSTYKVNGVTYNVYTGYPNSDLTSTNIGSLNAAVNSSGNNPGRIVYCRSGDFTLKPNISFTGTLVVRGKLKIDGANITLTAVPGYPALIVSDHIQIENDNENIVVHGPVVCDSDIKDGSKANCLMTFNGAVVLKGDVKREGTGSQIRINFDSTKAAFWDFARTANPTPYTVLEWKEN